MRMTIDLTEEEAMQDMITLIMRRKNITAVEAVSLSINQQNYKNIVQTGWASIAVSMWGHDDYDREWFELDENVFEIELDDTQSKYLADICKKEKTDTVTAISYFLIFTMDELGYHI